MEDLKEKLPMIIIGIIAVAICIGAIYFMEYKSFTYYTQIDNTKIEKVSSDDDMKYEYTLECYSKNGNKKELKFKTSRELRESAYLELDVKPVFGVHSWKEVQYNELPSKVQEKYK